jgi:ankyrin repeat protein
MLLSAPEVQASGDLVALLNYADRDGSTALMRAASPGHLAVVGALLGAGAGRELQDKRGRSALHCAVLKGRLPVVAMLLQGEGEGEGEGETLGSSGTAAGSASSLSLSTDSQRRLVGLLDKHSRSALHYAAFVPTLDERLVTSLVDARADLTQRDGYAQTALDRAVASGRATAVAALVKASSAAADGQLCEVDKHGRTPLHLAAAKHDVAVVSAMLAQSPMMSPEASCGPHRPDAERDRILNWRDRHSQTPLFVAAAAGLAPVASALLTAGAAVNCVDSFGCSALAAAAARGSEPVVRVLVDAGADLDLQDHDGCTALHRAAMSGHDEVVATLVAAGANVTLCSKNGVVYGDVVDTSRLVG